MRVKSKAAIKHRKVRKLAKGYHSARRKRFKTANEAVMHAGQYAFAGRKLRRRDLRSLWIMRIGAAVKSEGLSYSKFISLLKKTKIELDRKILADLAARNIDVFKKIVAKLKNE